MMNPRHWQWTRIITIALVALAGSHQSYAIDDAAVEAQSELGYWPQWRGPNRDNLSTETGLLKQWPEAGPPLLWRVDGLGRGIASVAAAHGSVYTVGYHFPDLQTTPTAQRQRGLARPRQLRRPPGRVPQGEYVMALDASSGQLRWATRIGNTVFENHLMRWLSQRTPTVDGDHVYVMTARGELVCLANEDGKELWRKHYVEDFKGSMGTWGFCDYPLVDGDQLICTPGGQEATIVALNKNTGELIWKCSIPDAGGSAYAATIPCDLRGIRQYAAYFRRGLYGVSAEDGRLLWHYDRFDNHMHALTPVIFKDGLICCNGHRGTAVSRLHFRPVGDGIELDEQQYHELTGGVINPFQDNTLLVDGRLFTGGRSRGLVCIDANTLQVLWREAVVTRRGGGMIGFTYANERLYVRSAEGDVRLVDPHLGDSQQVGAFTIPDAQRVIGVTMPVVVGGRLYLRDDERLFCYDVRESTEATAPAPTEIQLDLSGLVDDVAETTRSDRIRSVFVATPRDVVRQMLDLAGVNQNDVLCDLGSGDGRIVIEAAKRSGCTAIGYEIDSDLIKKSRQSAEEAGLSEQTSFNESDIADADLSRVTVVTLYLLPEQNRRLLPLLAKLPPGSRVVAHQNPIPGVRPDRVVRLASYEDADTHTLYLWTTPLSRTDAYLDDPSSE